MKRFPLLSWLLILAITAGGCKKFSLRSQTPDDDDDEVDSEPTTPFIGEQVTVSGLHTIQVEGVGLIMGLDGTGGDPPPSLYRTMLLDDMRKRSVKNPNAVLQSPNSALVIVRAVLPPVIQIGERFDVEVVLPDNTEATSLEGGHLMEMELAEQAIVPGRGPAKGHVMAKAKGPVLITTLNPDESSRAGLVKRGRVLGGGVYMGGMQHQERKLGLYLRNDYRSVRNAKRIADRIGTRFHFHEKGLKKPLAKATTDQHIELKVHARYKQNYVRYAQVVRAIPLRETPVELHARIERLRKSLLVPQTASKSALELEAIGGESIPVLKEGLKSKNAEVRFYSADALAYLGDSSGAKELVAAAEHEEAFRVFALAALATLEDPETHELLHGLMDETGVPEGAEVAQQVSANDELKVELANAKTDPKDTKTVDASGTQTASDSKSGPIRHGAETRYGAFHALWTMDKSDYFIRGEQFEDRFKMHVLKTKGDPMVHLTRNRVQEVVLFGADQELRTPITLSAGRHVLVNAPAGSKTVTVSRYEVGKQDQERTVSTKLADVIRAVGELGASYPDVAVLLTQAKRQSNLTARLEFDALPEAGRFYHRPPTEIADGTEAPRKTRVGRPGVVPNMFPSLKGDKGSERAIDDEEDEDTDDETGEASAVDVSESDDEAKPGRFAKIFHNPFKRKPE